MAGTFINAIYYLPERFFFSKKKKKKDQEEKYSDRNVNITYLWSHAPSEITGPHLVLYSCFHIIFQNDVNENKIFYG